MKKFLVLIGGLFGMFVVIGLYLVIGCISLVLSGPPRWLSMAGLPKDKAAALKNFLELKEDIAQTDRNSMEMSMEQDMRLGAAEMAARENLGQANIPSWRLKLIELSQRLSFSFPS